jgi:hypothetical protein
MFRSFCVVVLLACFYFSKSPSLLSVCRFLQLPLKMRAPIPLECKERTMPNTAIAMNGLLDAGFGTRRSDDGRQPPWQ